LTIDDRTLEIADVHCTDENLVVSLKDGRKIVTPLWWYPRLYQAAPEQRRRWELAGAGRGIHWPDVDEDLSLEGMLRGTSLRRPAQDRLSPHSRPPPAQSVLGDTTPGRADQVAVGRAQPRPT
jgi:hypothetical protein